MPGIKHQTKFVEEQQMDGFILIENIQHIQPCGRKIWGWKCKCNCGEEFFEREGKIESRKGCQKCTASRVSFSSKTATEKYGFEQVQIKRRKYKEYKDGASKRELAFDLTLNEFLDIIEKPCVYCGKEPDVYSGDVTYMNRTQEPWKRNGIDRVDSSKGYIQDNCVPCCQRCNYAKNDISVTEFIQYIKTCYNYITENNISSTTITKVSTLQAIGSGNGKHPTKVG